MPKCRFCDHKIPVGTYVCPNCGAPVDTAKPQAMEDLEQQVRLLLEQGKKLEAVKRYKEQTDVSLLEAKNAVEAIESGDLPPKPPVPDDEMEAELLRLLEAGDKIEACKLYRNRTGVQLIEAKQAVEALAARHGIASKAGGGCAGVLLAIVVAAVVVGVLM
jgi:ribosomal protein L7/L12